MIYASTIGYLPYSLVFCLERRATIIFKIIYVNWTPIWPIVKILLFRLTVNFSFVINIQNVLQYLWEKYREKFNLCRISNKNLNFFIQKKNWKIWKTMKCYLGCLVWKSRRLNLNAHFHSKAIFIHWWHFQGLVMWLGESFAVST